MGDQPIIARVLRDQALIDLRTVAPAEEDALYQGMLAAWRTVTEPR
jgi:hypothetical protein